GGGAVNAGVTGTLYIPSFSVENCVTKTLGIRLSKLVQVIKNLPANRSILETISSNNPSSRVNSVDYIFTDPPFGGNLMYSELNFIWESWLNTVTNNKSEAIENKVQGKGLLEYQALMTQCFQNFYQY
ncbi:MAG: hypothetical protein MJK14_27460, partial [Rivularia sp. ALOHA_DT_140]|nr:hypothetical protein [Rivularia sp. ALOHA_DT_140]